MTLELDQREVRAVTDCDNYTRQAYEPGGLGGERSTYIQFALLVPYGSISADGTNGSDIYISEGYNQYDHGGAGGGSGGTVSQIQKLP